MHINDRYKSLFKLMSMIRTFFVDRVQRLGAPPRRLLGGQKSRIFGLYVVAWNSIE
jgi:hypothetical protein